jgi:hypothetical protein
MGAGLRSIACSIPVSPPYTRVGEWQRYPSESFPRVPTVTP